MPSWQLRSGRALSRVAQVLVIVGIGLALPRPAHAYVWMIRHGQTECASCHADPSGGELLTRHGRAEGVRLLSMDYSFGRKPAGEPADATEPASGPRVTARKAPRTGFLWGLWDTPSWLLLGGALRVAGFAQSDYRVFPMQLDLYGQVKFGRFRAGGSLGAAKVKQNSENGRAAFVTGNQGNSFNLLSRTHWLAVDLGAHREWTLRAGRLNLPFGLRTPEHYLWTRDVTRTDRDADQQHGAALAYNGHGVRAEAMAIAGNYQIHPDRYRERGYSAYGEYAFTDRVAAGISSLTTVAKADRSSFEQDHTTRGVHGAFVRTALLKPLVLMAEVDLVTLSRRSLGYVGYVQVDYEPIQGLHLFATVEGLDRGRHDTKPGTPALPEVGGEGKLRPGGWLSIDWFFLPQLEARVDVVARQDAGAYLLTQIHAYL